MRKLFAILAAGFLVTGCQSAPELPDVKTIKVSAIAYLEAIQEGRQDEAKEMQCYFDKSVSPPVLDGFEITSEEVKVGPLEREYTSYSANVQYAGKEEVLQITLWNSNDFFDTRIYYIDATNRAISVGNDVKRSRGEETEALKTYPERSDIRSNDTCLEIISCPNCSVQNKE